METGGLGTGPVMDITPPGASPAPSSSKPVITDNQPLQADPMMAPKPNPASMPANNTAVEQPVVSAAPTPEPSSPAPESIAAPATPIAPAEPLHKLSHQEPFFGHVGKRKKNKAVILLVLLSLAGAAVASYLFLSTSS